MVADFSKILDHPNKEDIVDKLVHGTNPKDVSDWLKLKYPDKDQGHLRLNSVLLKQFVDSNLDLYQILKEDIKSVKEGKKVNKRVFESLVNNKSYRERLNEIADNEIDIKSLITGMVFLIRERVEQVFDKIQEDPSSTKPDYVLIKWFDTLLNATEKYDRIVNNAPDQIIQHNVTVQVVDKYIATVQDAVRETLLEVDPEAAFLFMEKINDKLGTLEMPEEMKSTKQISQEEKLLEARMISETVKNLEITQEDKNE